MNENAQRLNKEIESSVIYRLLSQFGKDAFMPNGITVQSNQCKEKATNYNATVGIATLANEPLALGEVRKFFSPLLTNSEVFSYSPSLGNPKLRQAWKKEILEKNPSIQGLISSPIVTAGLTNALFIISRLFIAKGDTVVLPSLYWENYDLIFDYNTGAKVKKFNFFSAKGFNIKSFKSTLNKIKSDKIVIVLNFPNNPTGYSPSVNEAEQIVDTITELADNGKDVLVILDDAYFSLFYEKNTFKESLFSLLSNKHERILAIKCDAATKEDEVWGFRIGFLTFGVKGGNAEQYKALEDKVNGVIRSSISNCSTSAQNILFRAMTENEERYKTQKAECIEIMKKRYKLFRLELIKHRDSFCYLKPLMFNSGYFMSFEVKDGEAENFRKALLNEEGIGVIALFDKYIRVAFSSLDEEKIPGFLNALYSKAEKFFAN